MQIGCQFKAFWKLWKFVFIHILGLDVKYLNNQAVEQENAVKRIRSAQQRIEKADIGAAVR